MKKLYYPAIFQKEGQGYSVWVYDFKGCVSQGDTIEEAIENITEALGIFIEEYKESDLELPQPTKPEIVLHDISSGQFVSLIEFDWLQYAKKYSTKSVKKTLTIPGWLNSAAEENHINFSSVLQEALKQQLHL